ncbi:copper chaperone PCu(A)C [Salinispirillum marinum]|uniref:Copper chaperone PCu(A)C n=2 Tax=Saccharospirillaceae TaxID=255527 RepID=A0ABV8BEJ7_9GAMM
MKHLKAKIQVLLVCAAAMLAPLAVAMDHGSPHDKDHDSSHYGTSGVMIHHPYVRLMPPMQPNTAAFMRLENTTSEDRQLIAVYSDIAEVVELHTHNRVDGVMQMRRVSSIDVPAGESATLQPGGYHIMLIGLKAPLQDGQVVQMTLQFDDGSEQNLQAPVQHPNAEMSRSHGH